MITPVESDRQADRLMEAIHRAERTGDAEAAEAAYRRALAFPCADHQFHSYELWGDLARVQRGLRRFDEAIESMREAMAAGYRSWPHPEAEIAELHLAAGRRKEADELYASLRERTPHDVWLYNSAGFSYAEARDHDTAARWFGDGIELAMADGDPEQIVDQLHGQRLVSLRALGREPDELAQRAERFLTQSLDTPTRWGGTGWPEDLEPPPEPKRCRHCGWEPPSDGAVDLRGRAGRRPVTDSDDMSLAFAWFPADQWPEARTRFGLDDLPEAHDEYSRVMHSKMLELSRELAGRLHVAPIRIEELVAFAATRGLDPESDHCRAAMATELVRTGRAIPWPPGRNDPCFCGSGTKYKRCCGGVR